MIFQGDSDDMPINYTSQFSSNFFDFSSKQEQTNISTIQKQSQNDSFFEDEQDEKFFGKVVLKRIKKDKKKIIVQPQQAPKNNLQQKAMRYCLTQISKPIFSPYLFLFTGNIIVEFIDSLSDSEITNTLKPLVVQQLVKKDATFSVKPSFIDISQDYDMAIYLLENKQCQLQYELAQMMKKYRILAQDQEKSIKRIKEVYRNDFEILQCLQADRAKYRNEIIDQYIQENMQDEDFYACFDNGIDFHNNVTCPLFIKFSKNIFALFGLEEDNVHLFLTKKEAFPKMIPDLSRKQLTWIAMQLRLQDDRSKKLRLKGFEINTLEELKMYCDIEAFVHTIKYPTHLQYINDHSQDLEEVIFTKFIITAQHLQYILSQRNSDTVFPMTEDIEYSVYSQIFLEKYYPNELRELNKEFNEDKDTSTITLEQENEIEEINQKTCGYRFIQ